MFGVHSQLLYNTCMHTVNKIKRAFHKNGLSIVAKVIKGHKCFGGFCYFNHFRFMYIINSNFTTLCYLINYFNGKFPTFPRIKTFKYSGSVFIALNSIACWARLIKILKVWILHANSHAKTWFLWNKSAWKCEMHWLLTSFFFCFLGQTAKIGFSFKKKQRRCFVGQKGPNEMLYKACCDSFYNTKSLKDTQ